MGYNADQPRDDHGRWGSGSSGAATAKLGFTQIKAVHDWVKSGEPQRALAGAITGDRVRAAVAFGIQSAIYHVAQVDEPSIDALVHSQVEHMAANLQVASGRARELMAAGVAKLIAARQKAVGFNG